jgi:hypothetical protein
MWISPEFKIYLVKEYQRLQEKENKSLDWNVKRALKKINYRIHTDAIQQHLIPKLLSKKEISMVYANEADILNMALFGKTAQQWREVYPDLEKHDLGDLINQRNGLFFFVVYVFKEIKRINWVDRIIQTKLKK